MSLAAWTEVMDKLAIVGAFIELLKGEIQGAKRRLETARQASIDAPGAMQSHSDTTKYQMGLVADGLRRFISEKEEAVSALAYFRSTFSGNASTIIGPGSVAEVESGGKIGRASCRERV